MNNNIDIKKELVRIKENSLMKLNTLENHIRRDGEWDQLSVDAQRYLRIPHILVGAVDIRARIGTFHNPWFAKPSLLFQPPRLEFIKDSLDDLVNQRTVELFKLAKDTKKHIIIMWSGGIDSTLILTSFLKNIPTADHEMITVALTLHSIADNPTFYFNFISNNKKIRVISATELEVTNDFLNKNIILHGDPGDGILGPSTGMYTKFSSSNQHLEPWKKHLKAIEEELEPTMQKFSFVQPGIGKWFTNIVVRTLEESGYADHVSTVADWYWWTYFNFKYSSMCTYPIYHTRLKKDLEPLSIENIEFYSKTVFYHTAKFQCWSYSNLKELVRDNVFKSYKLKAREYIYDFDKNFVYFSKKRKTSTTPPTIKKQKIPVVGYDKHFQPFGTNQLKPIFLMLLKHYKEEHP